MLSIVRSLYPGTAHRQPGDTGRDGIDQTRAWVPLSQGSLPRTPQGARPAPCGACRRCVFTNPAPPSPLTRRSGRPRPGAQSSPWSSSVRSCKSSGPPRSLDSRRPLLGRTPPVSRPRRGPRPDAPWTGPTTHMVRPRSRLQVAEPATGLAPRCADAAGWRCAQAQASSKAGWSSSPAAWGDGAMQPARRKTVAMVNRIAANQGCLWKRRARGAGVPRLMCYLGESPYVSLHHGDGGPGPGPDVGWGSTRRASVSTSIFSLEGWNPPRGRPCRQRRRGAGCGVNCAASTTCRHAGGFSGGWTRTLLGVWRGSGSGGGAVEQGLDAGDLVGCFGVAVRCDRASFGEGR